MKKKIFIYSKKERWGVLSLSLLNLILLLTSFSYVTPSYQYSYEQIFAFQSSVLDEEKEIQSIVVVDSLFEFNPNEVSKDSLLALGFSNRVAGNIINYRNKGGHFYQAKALQKIYGMDSLFFEKIKDYCVIPENIKSSKKPFPKHFAQARKAPKRFPFDPNKATKQELLDLGFSKKSARILVNYRKKGGHFFKPESVKKIFGVTENFYQSIAPLIQINKAQFALGPKPSKKENQSNFSTKSGFVRSIDKKIEINSATIKDWEALPGIGPFYAKNIVKLREKLGGFYQLEQIKETYKFQDSIFQIIQPYLVVDAKKITKIDLQRASFKEIVHHPYISYEETKLIMKAQEEGQLYDPKDLRNTKIFSVSKLNKLMPYLAFPEASFEE